MAAQQTDGQSSRRSRAAVFWLLSVLPCRDGRVARCDEDGAWCRLASYCGECQRVSTLATVLRGCQPLCQSTRLDSAWLRCHTLTRARVHAGAGAHAELQGETHRATHPPVCRVIDSGRSVKIWPVPIFRPFLSPVTRRNILKRSVNNFAARPGGSSSLGQRKTPTEGQHTTDDYGGQKRVCISDVSVCALFSFFSSCSSYSAPLKSLARGDIDKHFHATRSCIKRKRPRDLRRSVTHTSYLRRFPDFVRGMTWFNNAWLPQISSRRKKSISI